MTLRDIRSARERVLAFLVAEAGDDGRTIAFDGSLRDIAVAIGLTPEAFYRTLAQLDTRKNRLISGGTVGPARFRDDAGPQAA